jgi:hypothetical protein
VAETSVLSFDEVAWLRDNSSAWRLLRADNASLVLSFLHRVFVAENVRSIPVAELASRLDDELDLLDPEEAELYHDLLDGTLGPSIRLEQERISFAAIEQALDWPT